MDIPFVTRLVPPSAYETMRAASNNSRCRNRQRVHLLACVSTKQTPGNMRRCVSALVADSGVPSLCRFGTVGFTNSELLAIWEGAHGELAPEWRERLLADERVQELARLDTPIVRPAIERTRSWIRLSIKPTLRSREAPRRQSRERQTETLAATISVGTFHTSQMMQKSTNG